MRPIIRNPTRIRTEAAASGGTIPARGYRKMAKRNRTPTTTDVKPVRPPSAIPADLSI